MTTKRKIIFPTPEEDAEITANAQSDLDNPPLTDAQLGQFKPLRSRGRPIGSGKKVQMTVRFDTDVVDAFKSAGDGWQTRMNDALKEWLKTHRVI
jgi:uncharacterized protein (DUF4415 family)